jgi:hypothetical protein
MRRARFVWCLLLLAGLAAIIVAVRVGEGLYVRGLDRAIVRSERLRAVYAVLVRYEADHGQPPAAAADLAPYRTAHPTAVESVERGEVVVVWGRTVRARREGLVAVAYAPLDDKPQVLVLWSDGSVSGEDVAKVPDLVRE